MFFSSLPTWVWILAALVIFCPLAGKQIAKDALKIKDSLKSYDFKSFWLFPLSTVSGNDQSDYKSPVNTMTEKQYVQWMMAGGVLGKLLWNLLLFLLIFAIVVPGLFIYSCVAFFRGIFSTK